jgi:hypothetical protein
VFKSVDAKNTVLGSANEEQITAQEKLELAEQWAMRTLDSLLAYAYFSTNFAGVMCNKVIDQCASVDKLSALISKRFRVAREGKPRSRPRKWDDARYQVLLEHYSIACHFWGREEALRWAAESEQLTGDNSMKAIEERITEARRRLKEGKFDIWLPPELHNRGG